MKTKLKYTNLTEYIVGNKERNDCGIRFINSNEDEHFLSYSDLYNEAIMFLGFLKESYGIKPKEKLIIYEEDRHIFLVCFWACILGGVIPIPLAIGGKKEHKLKFFEVWKDLNGAYVFSNHKIFSSLKDFAEKNKMTEEFKVLHHSFIDSNQTLLKHNKGKIVQSNSQDIAFIQYSSGSTGSPKGVVLTHENLVYNTHDIVERTELNENDNILNWVPLTHDMGMVGFHLSCMLVSCNQFIMPTSLFIRRPLLWMEKTHQYRATVLVSPNFGYQYFLQALERQNKLQQWDLSTIRSILNGAEPISSELCKKFVQNLSVYGLKNTCIIPCYGLAESSVAVAMTKHSEPLKEYFILRNSLAIEEKVKFANSYDKDFTVSFVHIGKALTNCKIRIVGKKGQLLEKNTIGHIEIRGKNVTQEYYLNQKETKKAFTKDGWLKTGDLGLLLEDSSLIVTGRHKNIVILQGQNYYAHDLEAMLLDIPEISLGKVVACGIAGAGKSKEKLIIFVFYKKPLIKFLTIVNAIQEKLSGIIGIIPDEIIPVREIPKTTSGKVQHGVLLNRYLQGQFTEVITELNKVIIEEITSSWDGLEGRELIKEIKKWILDYCADLIHRDVSIINTAIPLVDQGFKSIHAVQLSQLLNKKLGISTTVTLLYQYPTINQLAELIKAKLFPHLKIGFDSNNDEKVITDDDDLFNKLESLSEEEVIKMLDA